jgi:hypothetical protein
METTPQPPPIWDAATGRFDRVLLRQALMMRGISPEALRKATRLHPRTIGKVRHGDPVSDETAVRVLRELERVQPTGLVF